MTNVDFGIKLTEAFPAFRAATSETFLRGILALTESISDDGRDGLWYKFYDVYDRTTIPTRPVFAKLIEELGLKVRGRGGKADRHPMYRCSCGAEFSPDRMRCPKCSGSSRDTLTVFWARGEAPAPKQTELIRVDVEEITASLADRKSQKAGVR